MELETIQTIFYTLGIIFMSLALLLLIAVIILLFYIKKKITDIHQQVEERINLLINDPAELVVNAGAKAIKEVKKRFTAA